MSKRTRNRIILVAGFLVCLGIVITIISLIIAAICSAVSGGPVDQTGDIAQVEVIYDTSAAASSTSTTSNASSTESTENTSSTASSESGDNSSNTENTASTASAGTTSGSTVTSNTSAKAPEDFVADFASSAA